MSATSNKPRGVKVDSYLVPETVAKPNSFTGLMSLYESNFLRMQALIPTLATITGLHRSDVSADLPLHLEVLERTRYTATLSLTYWFDEGGEAQDDTAFADPDLTLRVYFDGQLAEVMSLAASHRHHVLRDIAASHREELDIRWRRNVMLNKWLEYLLDSGHQFR
ncbi:MAG: DUF1249 domain-containing protein [Pseudomonadota bacterium]